MSKFNYFSVISVAVSDFPTDPQVNFGFNSQGFSLLNTDDYVISYSFNGTDVHGTLDPANASVGLVFDARVESKIWFKATGGTGSVRVEAWGT